MAFPRNRCRVTAQAIVRSSKDSNTFFTEEIHTRGDGTNVHRQCARGELLFNPDTKKFVNVASSKEEREAGSRLGGTKIPESTKSNRKPFDPKKVAASTRFSLADRFPKKASAKEG